MKTLRITFSVCALFLLHITGVDAQWTSTNGPNGGEVVYMATSGINIYAGTWGSGAWKRPLSELITSVSSNKLPDGNILMQNYPNPFTGTTTLKFNISAPSFVKLSVIDINGIEVTTLINEQLATGTHQVVWNGTGHPAGIYSYKLVAGDFVKSRKMILIK